MKCIVETRITGDKSRKFNTSALEELSLRKAFFSDKKHGSHQGKEPSLFHACAVFLAKKVFPACYFALHDSLRDTRPFRKHFFFGNAAEVICFSSCLAGKMVRKNVMTPHLDICMCSAH